MSVQPGLGGHGPSHKQVLGTPELQQIKALRLARRQPETQARVWLHLLIMERLSGAQQNKVASSAALEV